MATFCSVNVVTEGLKAWANNERQEEKQQVHEGDNTVESRDSWKEYLS